MFSLDYKLGLNQQHNVNGGPVEDRTPIWALQVPRVPQYHYQPIKLFGSR